MFKSVQTAVRVDAAAVIVQGMQDTETTVPYFVNLQRASATKSWIQRSVSVNKEERE